MKFHIASTLRLLRCNPDDLKGWDVSGRAARLSFLLLFLVLPVYFLTLDSLARPHLQGVPPLAAWGILGADYLLQWVAFPLAVALLLDLTRLSKKSFPAFVIVTNLLGTFGAFVLVPLLLLFRFGVLSEDLLYAIMSLFFMVMAILLSRWAMLLFETGLGFAVIVFLISNLTSQLISLTTLELLKLYQNPT
jgi:hypothetical protein